MGRTRVTFYINKVPDEPLKGRAWIDISDIETAKRLNIPLTVENTTPTIFRKCSLEEVERAGLKLKSNRDVNKVRGVGIYSDGHPEEGIRVAIACRRGKAGGKKFIVVDPRENVSLIVQKSLTVNAVCSWVKTWASEETEIITPGGKTVSLDGNNINSHSEFVYFIHSKESNTIKIGRAKDVEKRLKSLQTAHPFELKIIQTVKVNSSKAAQELENSLHMKFNHLRLMGEWFKAQQELLEHKL